MNKIQLLICAFCLLLISCGETEKPFDFKKQGGVRITIQIPVSLFLQKLTKEANNEDLKYALENVNPELRPESYFKSLFDVAKNGKMPFDLKSVLFVEHEDLFHEANKIKTDEAFIEAVLKEYESGIDKTIPVLENRLVNFQVSAVNSYREANNIILEIPGSYSLKRIRHLLQSTVDVGFYTPYLAQDAFLWFKKANEYSLTQEDSVLNPNNNIDRNVYRLFDHLVMNYAMHNQYASAEIGHAKAEDTAGINQYLNKIYATYTPLDSKFIWGFSKVEHIEGNNYHLYCLQNPPRLKGDIIAKAKQEFDYNGSPCLTIYFNPDGTREWGLYTEERVGEHIAIVVNNYVYSAPVVNEKIPGGVSQVTGNMNVSETKDMASILNAGTLPYPIIITEEEISGPSL